MFCDLLEVVREFWFAARVLLGGFGLDGGCLGVAGGCQSVARGLLWCFRLLGDY